MQLFVWNQHSTQPILKYRGHTAAVKAIAWSPHQSGLLASGGGTNDQCIRFWNTNSNSHLGCINTGSQVDFSLVIKHFQFVNFLSYGENCSLTKCERDIRQSDWRWNVGCRGPGCCVGCIKLETESCQILWDDCIKNNEKNWDSNLLRLNFSDVG